MKRSYTRYLILFIGLLSIFSIKLSTAQSNEYKFHTVYIYSFTKYMQWPNNSGDFVIGVLGSSPIISELEKQTSNRTVGSQKIVVKQFSSTNAIAGCNILFIPNSQHKALEEVKEKAKKGHILLITETPGLAQKGSNINFVIKDGKLKFELNEQTCKDSGIKVSNELIKLSIQV